MTPLFIDNKTARKLWLWTNGLANTPNGPLDVMAIVRHLGFIQIDTIRNVTRAHNHIIWTRNQNFTEGGLWPHLEKRQIFEHFTHDASLIDAAVYPFWQGQFKRLGAQYSRSDWFKSGLARKQIQAIYDRIEREGPLSTHAFDTKIEGPRVMWARPPHKKALDQMWYGGRLSTSHRKNFVKYYDVGARVFASHPDDFPPQKAADNWLYIQAMDRLSFGTQGEIQRFWQTNNAATTRAWIKAEKTLVPIQIEAADGTITQGFAPEDIGSRLNTCPEPTKRLRLINPFDPAIRDRIRLERLFGFEYRNEMFVPKVKRKWGYYVYPLLEGAKFVGRVELKADRKLGILSVTGFWPEEGAPWSQARLDRLDAELSRFARFAGIKVVNWDAKRPK